MILPEEFETYTRNLMGEELFSSFLKGINEEPPTSIRINPFKVKDEKFGVTYSKIGWCKNGLYLNERPNFTFDPLFHAGLYYVQEASSMFIDHVLRHLIHRPVDMLDLCAAPGGKTTCAMSALPSGSIMFCNEPMKTRSQILCENIQKFGHPDIIVTNNYPKDYKKSKLLFDVILTDVPCSGEGMFRKDAGAIGEWSVNNVKKCQQLQRDIVSDIWSCLKPGGILIYSTCTFNAHEDEENVNWIREELGASFIDIPTEKEWNITGSLIDDNPVYRFIPGITKGEGLFMAVLRKDEDNDCNNNNRIFDKKCDGALKSLHILSHGIKEDTIKGKNKIPDESKALSLLNEKDAYPKVELSYKDAINYLRTEAITLDATVPRGIILLTFHDNPIGFAKNLGNRANNLYPSEWKIRSSHVPENYNGILDL